MKRSDDRFPGALKILRAKFPKGPIVQMRIETKPGDMVEFRGALGPPGSPFDKVIEAVRAHCQEPGGAPSEPGHEGKNSPKSARVDPKRGEVRREPVRGEPRAPHGRGDEKVSSALILHQAWEESERGWGVRPDGYSLHIDKAHRDKFVDDLLKRQSDYFKGRGLKDGDAPDEYTRISGDPRPVSVTRAVYEQLVDMGGNYQGHNADGVRIDNGHLVTPAKKLPTK
ncbi:MAG TPA: hypothetical protein VFA98_13180 [Thermoanaerobaculia bacterium]|jgi:hypothetical protein|nr:hypothetical protein [Thermoanaerobaculia bacterium]